MQSTLPLHALSRACLPALCAIAAGFTCASAADQYVLPNGAGSKDGSNWANAADASAGGLQASWDKIQPGDTCFVGGGSYQGQVLKIGSGGTADRYKKLAGVDSGKGGPQFTSSWSKSAPEKGSNFITFQKGASWVSIENIKIENYRIGIVTNGDHKGLRVTNFDVTNSREGIVLSGEADRLKPESGNKDIVIKDCEFKNYTKRGIRIRDGNSNIKIVNCVADAGGKDFAVEIFPIGFSVQGDSQYFYLSRKKDKTPEDKAKQAEMAKNLVYDQDITFENCTAANNFSDGGGKKYWNGDGFCVERTPRRIRYINCRSMDNTDGGWDDKSDNPVLINCVSLRNKENFRFWASGQPAELWNCLSVYAIKRGGSGPQSGFWACGNVVARYCTFYKNGVLAETAPSGQAANLKFTDCIFSSPPSEHGSGKAQLTNCIVIKSGDPASDPKFNKPDNTDWNGVGPDLDSATFGLKLGYNSTRQPPAK